MRFFTKAAVVIILLAFGGVASAQDAAPQTGAFEAVWPLPPAAQIDAELRQFTARYDGQYADQTGQRLRKLQAAQQAGGDDAASAQRYAVFVPENYDPARPPGVMVFVNSDDGPNDAGPYRQALNDRNLIWVSPAGVGNEQDVPWREWVAINALREVQSRYHADPQRLYVAGHSGGGRVASRLMVIASDFFNGGFCFCGANYPSQIPAGDGRSWPGFWPQPDRRLLANAMRNSRIVLFTGDGDMNRDGTQRVYQQGRKDGFQKMAYLEAPNHGHHPPDADYFGRGVALLDSPLVAAASEAAARAGNLEKVKPAEALALYEQAALYAPLAEDGVAAAADVKAKADALRARYAQAVAAAESAVTAGDRPAAAKALAELRRWSPRSADDVKRLTAAIRNIGKKP